MLLCVIQIPMGRERLLNDIIGKSSAYFELDDQVDEDGLFNALLVDLGSQVLVVFNRLFQQDVNIAPPVTSDGLAIASCAPGFVTR